LIVRPLIIAVTAISRTSPCCLLPLNPIARALVIACQRISAAVLGLPFFATAGIIPINIIVVALLLIMRGALGNTLPVLAGLARATGISR